MLNAGLDEWDEPLVIKDSDSSEGASFRVLVPRDDERMDLLLPYRTGEIAHQLGAQYERWIVTFDTAEEGKVWIEKNADRKGLEPLFMSPLSEFGGGHTVVNLTTALPVAAYELYTLVNARWVDVVAPCEYRFSSEETLRDLGRNLYSINRCMVKKDKTLRNNYKKLRTDGGMHVDVLASKAGLHKEPRPYRARRRPPSARAAWQPREGVGSWFALEYLSEGTTGMQVEEMLQELAPETTCSGVKYDGVGTTLWFNVREEKIQRRLARHNVVIWKGKAMVLSLKAGPARGLMRLPLIAVGTWMDALEEMHKAAEGF